MGDRTKHFLKGALRSWTAHAGTLVLVVGYLQDQTEWLTTRFGPGITGDILMLLGVLMIVLRAKTTQSLESKGAE